MQIEMQKDTIVFLNDVKLTSLAKDMISMQKFSEAGYRIVYMDLSEYYFPKTYNVYSSDNINYIMNPDHAINCNNKDKILEVLERESPRSWFYIMHRVFMFEIKDAWLFRMLKKYNCSYFLVCEANLFVPADIIIHDNISVVKYIVSNFSFIFLKKQLKTIFHKIVSYCIWNRIFLQKPRFLFTAGKTTREKAKLIYPKTEIIDIPSYDYRQSIKTISRLKNNPQKSSYPDRYIIYLDQSVFNCPDAKLNRQKAIDRDIFFRKINNFFNRIEIATCKSVIIAASPKQKYNGDEYNGRKIVYNVTSEAVYYSDMIIAHMTTAINFAIIMEKPILLLTFKEFSDYQKSPILDWAHALKKVILDSEEQFDRKRIEDIAAVNQSLYNLYLENYIVSGCPDNESKASIIIEKLKNANNDY